MEVLVVLEAAHAAQALDELRRHAPVIGVLPPRLAVVAAAAGQVRELRTLPGLEALFENEIPEAFRASLEPGERLFAEAWLARQREKGKPRPGDGLPWDAPGFLPPDKSPHR